MALPYLGYSVRVMNMLYGSAAWPSGIEVETRIKTPRRFERRH
ncbi:hypothetical protein [Oleiagrimonas sp.]|jgi:hypothetical protein|nr:hypothetical protein [Oleiagrimonas sp.]MDA3914288.1 hypothetical protein [Oleiagrimonas sp.]